MAPGVAQLVVMMTVILRFSRNLRLNALVLVALSICARSPVLADDLPALPVDSGAVVAAATESGFLTAADFETIDDPYVGTVLVGRPDDGQAISVVIFEGPEGPTQVQIIMLPPWENIARRIDIAASIADLLVSRPDYLPPPPPVVAGTEPMEPMATWLYGLMYEAWLGWPGAEQRLVRERDGIAVIVEGTPPDNWSITFAVDRDYGDETWPATTSALDPPGVAEARELIRVGEYDAAADVLLPLSEAEIPQAARLLGDMYRFGRLGTPHAEDATDWYLIASRFRLPIAVWSLAAMKTENWGMFFVSNFKGPILDRASEVGSADALFLLSGTQPGVNYMRPPGVTAFDQALEAAQWGLLQAQFDMARRYAEGDGVDADPVEAYAWSLAALAATDPGLDYIPARALADDLRQPLDEDQAARAEARAAELVTGPPPWPPEGRLVPGMEGYTSEPAAEEP